MNTFPETAPIWSAHFSATRHLDSLLDLTSSPIFSSDSLEAILKLVTERAAAALGVERVSVWRYDVEHTAIHCVDLFHRSTATHSQGTALRAIDYPHYFAAVAENVVIAASYAASDSRTCEFRQSYLEPLGIVSMLDAPIRVHGELDGVLCCEQIGEPRQWDYDDENFALALANLVGRSIADVQRRTAALQASERRYRSLFQSSPLPAYVVDLATHRLIDVSDAMVDHYGYTRDELLQKTMFDFRPPEDEPRVRAAVAELSNVNRSMGVWRHLKKDGTRIDVEISAQLIEFDGTPAGLVLAVDITDRLQAERALRESQERFSELASNFDGVFWIRDSFTKQMIYVSPAIERIWNRPAPEFLALPNAWLDTIHSTDRDRMARVMAEVENPTCEEYQIDRPSGGPRWIRDRAFPVRDFAGCVVRVVGVAEDITDQKELEAKYLRAQRMESLGRLAAGIAHDLNNVLAPILLAAPLLRSPMPKNDCDRIVETLERSAKRGAELVKQLLFFGRGDDGLRTRVRIKDVVREIEVILKQTLPKNCRFNSIIPGDLWLVLADATQIHQVLLNLCVNACDAMPKGGSLTITAENRVLSDVDARAITDARAGAYVLLRIEDTGTGIEPALLAKIFDPFFTTKAVGKGTGLGLATVASITRTHGGFVTIKSEVGRGSTFCVGFPALVDEQKIGSGAESHVDLPPRAHGEEILVVDDEEAVRSMVNKVLLKHGYKVRLAASGLEGATAFVRHSSTVKAVLTDLAMPQMDGVTLVNLIRRLNNRVPVVIATGNGSAEHMTQSLAELERLGISSVLPKPFSVPILLGALHEAIQGVPPS